ncbi:putative staphylococcal protein [Staphylococcus caeli]|uniref:Staphylococcal protein n=2 Tax=Staphylococcus caeli TaxID=2201815 RepID=A0A1D4P2T3_9STAP|nr:putative staphylococcal protein [Staphylococcus caeli]SCT17228.1 putative staphylococcal protein [Staphylococcus caeli]
MNMIVKEDFIRIEVHLDEYAKAKKLNTKEAKKLLDDYFSLIEQYFKQINEIDTIDFNALETYPVVPMNFEERYEYMVARKYHFMGFSQMKTLKTELIKMNAAYQIMQKNKF